MKKRRVIETEVHQELRSDFDIKSIDEIEKVIRMVEDLTDSEEEDLENMYWQDTEHIVGGKFILTIYHPYESKPDNNDLVYHHYLFIHCYLKDGYRISEGFVNIVKAIDFTKECTLVHDVTVEKLIYA